MKRTLCQSSHARSAFTLIELLVVIAVIGILAGLLLPAIARAKAAAKVTVARSEITSLASALTKYESDYSRYPASSTARMAADTNDFTFGTYYRTDTGSQTNLLNQKGGVLPTIANNFVTPYESCNAEVMSALMDFERFKDGRPTPNFNHALNPNKTSYLNVKEVGDSRSAGVGQDGVYRDPWGNPYIITLDMNGDNKCRDAFYRLDSVSRSGGNAGFNGLYRSGGPDSFEANQPVMVWSFGPDGKVNNTKAANAAENKDNILSW